MYMCKHHTPTCHTFGLPPPHPSVGPSIDPSGISFVDSIRLYSKAKSVVGWPEGPSEVPPTQSNGSVPQQAGEMSPLEENTETTALPTTVKSLSGLDRSVLSSQCHPPVVVVCDHELT